MNIYEVISVLVAVETVTYALVVDYPAGAIAAAVAYTAIGAWYVRDKAKEDRQEHQQRQEQQQE